MKKIYLTLVMIAAAITLVACGSKETLVVFIPNDYIDEELIKEFKKEHKVNVKLIPFNNNEIALTQIRSNSYDVVIPSDYAIEELANNDLIEKIDYKDYLGEGFEFTPQLDAFIKQLSNEGFNFLDYAVPYFWGSVGILYNTKVVSYETVAQKGYEIIGDQNIKTIIYDSSRDGLMVGLLNVNDGVLLKDATQADINAAEKWLIDAKGPNTQVKSDQILTEMLKGTRYDAVVAYSGDATYIMEENSNYNFFIPKKTNVWADGFVIPKNAKQKELAKEFIKFMTSYDSSLANTTEVGYSSARKDVYDLMIGTNGDYSSERLITSYESHVDEFQIFRHNDALKSMIDLSWSRFMSAK